jgi:hypothetical protein
VSNIEGPGKSLQLIVFKLVWQLTSEHGKVSEYTIQFYRSRVDLERLTRELITAMEQDLGTHFEWVATALHNTEHPHVHVALRGVTPEKKLVFFPRSYIQHGIRQHAEELTTAQLGPRTLSDRVICGYQEGWAEQQPSIAGSR